MKQFTPPIQERETEELIEIANCLDESVWQREATMQAQNELLKRNISQEQQNEVIERWKKELDLYFKKEAEKLENNKTQSYTLKELILIFIFGPIRFLHRFDPIFTLRRENYFLKFKQRFILLSLGSLTWFVLIYSSFKYYEQNRLEDIEKVEISNGKRNLDMNKNNIIE